MLLFAVVGSNRYRRLVEIIGGGERPALTAAAISCGFSAGEYKSELCKKWFKYCSTAIPINEDTRPQCSFAKIAS